MCAPRYTTCSCLIHIVIIINNIIEVLVIVVRCQSIVVLSIYIERTTFILNAVLCIIFLCVWSIMVYLCLLYVFAEEELVITFLFYYSRTFTSNLRLKTVDVRAHCAARFFSDTKYGANRNIYLSDIGVQ